jgi:hypothetical protein
MRNKAREKQKVIQNSLLEKLFVIVVHLAMLAVIPYWYQFIIVPKFVIHWIIFGAIIFAAIYSTIRGVQVLRDKLDIRDYLNLSKLEKTDINAKK